MEDKKYPIAGYAPGSYQCKCADCGVIFLGDKRGIQCEPCATEAMQEYESLTPKQKARYDNDRAQIFKLVMEMQTLKQQIAASQPTSGQAVWVKAAERLPIKEYNYFVKATTKWQGYNHNDTAWWRDRKWEFDRDNGRFVVEWLDESDTATQSGKEEAVDLVSYAAAVEEGAEAWKMEYDSCRKLLKELVDLKNIKDSEGKSEDYLLRQPIAWERAKHFLERYQHINW